MGYCSQVTLTLYKDDLINLVRSAKRESTYAYDLIKYAKAIVSETDEDVVTLHWDCVKWYNGGVPFINSFLQSSSVQYVFKRVGEENGDIEEEQNDDEWYLSDHTSIVCYIEIDGIEQDDWYIDRLATKAPDDIPDEKVVEVAESEFLDVLDAS